MLSSVLWIRTGFNADPDPGSEFLCKKNIPVLKVVGNRSKTYLRRYKKLFGRQATMLIGKLWSISMLLDLDSG